MLLNAICNYRYGPELEHNISVAGIDSQLFTATFGINEAKCFFHHKLELV